LESSEVKKDIGVIAILFGSILVFFWRLVLHPTEMIYSPHSDIVQQFYPWWDLAGEYLKEGRLPIWNPYNFSGEPLLANMQLGLFYPPNLVLFLLFSTDTAIGISFLAHLSIAGVGMYLVGKRFGLDRTASLLAALILLFSGYFMGHIYAGHFSLILATAWIPFIFLSFDAALRKASVMYGVLLGTLLGLQFLSGHIQTTLITFFLLGSYLIFHLWTTRKNPFRKMARKLAVLIPGAVFAFIVSFVQLIPTYRYATESTRNGGTSYEFATSYSLPPLDIIGAVLPRFFGDPVSGTYWNTNNWWEFAFFMGVPTLILIALAFHYRRERPVQFLSILAVVSFVLALGEHTPVYWVLWKFMPGMDLVRVPARFLLLFIFCCALLAGFGLKYLKEDIDSRTLRRYSTTTLHVALFGAIASLIMMVFRDPLVDLFTSSLSRIGTLSTGKAFLAFDNVAIDFLALSLLLIAAGALILYKMKNGRFVRMVPAIFSGAILLSLGIAHMNLIDTRDPGSIYAQPEHIIYLSENIGDSRIFDPENLITDNYQIVYGIQTLEGYNPIMLEDYSDVMDPMSKEGVNCTHSLLDLLNVKYVLTSTMLNGTDMRLVFNDTEVYVYENDDALGYGFIVHNAIIGDESYALEMILNESFDPSMTAILSELPAGFQNFTDPGPENLTIVYKGLDQTSFTVNMSSPGFLVLSETFYRDCRVYVDGVKDRPLKVDYTLTGVYLEAGEHEVRFVHEMMI
jgi:hypothetical protein